MRVQFAGLPVGHPDRRGKVLAESGHPQGQDVDSGVGLAVKTQRTGNPAGGVLSIPWTSPRADAFSRYSTICAVMRLYTSFLSVVFCIVFFSFKTDFFFAKTRDGFEGVQRRGPVKGAGKFRVHRRPLTGSTAGITPVLRRRGLSG